MKKLGLSLIAVAGMFFFSTNVQAQTETETTTDMQTTTQAQEDWASVDVAALPQTVKDAVMNDYTGATTEKAWSEEESGKTIYKLSLNVNGETKTVYADQDGNWIQKSDEMDEMDEE
ncbi:MAG: hypothetical protein WBV11_06790 [Salegentibacter sp.]